MDEGTAIAVDDSGNVYVTGTTSSGWCTVKYSAAGAQQWYKTFGVSGDEARALVLDGSGNAYVAGASTANGTSDMVVVKYNPQGDTQWVRRYDGPAHQVDEANALAMDAFGCVFVAGYSTGASTGPDYMVVKYSPSGDSLSAWSYHGLGNAPDIATAVAVCPAGNVVYVTGNSDSVTQDIVTVRFEQHFYLDAAVTAILSPPEDVDSGIALAPVAVVANLGVHPNDTVFTFRFGIGLTTGYTYCDTVTLGLPPGRTDTIVLNDWTPGSRGLQTARCSLLTPDSFALNNFQTRSVYVAGSGWRERASMPSGAKAVKDGGWLAYDGGKATVFASRGNKQPDFFSYNPVTNAWTPRHPWEPGDEGKMPYKGSVGCASGTGVVYATKGNNTLGFWKYVDSTDVWSQQQNVPLGPSNKKVKGGTDMVYVVKNGTGYVYLLKGYKNEFWRYNTVTNAWDTLDSAPIGGNIKWDKGSWLAYDGAHTIYAHKAKYHEFYRYDTEKDSWNPTALVAMPIAGSAGSKKSKDGGCGAYLSGCVYALKGGNTQELWKYSVATNSWAEKETIPKGALKKKVKAGGDIVTGGQKLFALKGNKSNEFWRYLPTSAGDVEAVTQYAPGGRSGRDDPETPVLEGISAFSPNWRSDGGAVVVSAEDTATGYLQLWEVTYGGGGIGSVSRLVDVAMDCEQPVYNPAGTAVAFTLDDTASGFYQIAVVSTGTFDGGRTSGGESDVTACGTEACLCVARRQAQPTTCFGPGVVSLSRNAAIGSALSAKSLQSGLASARRIPAKAPAFNDITVITQGSHDHYDPAWSPGNGDYIVYTKDGEDGSHIWRVPSGGGEEQQLTSGSDCEEFEPSYLNGDEVVFTRSPDDPAEADQVAKVTVGSTTMTDLTTSEYDHEAVDPAPNGSWVVAQAWDDNGSQVIKVPASGGSETFLTQGSTKDMEEPDWSPDNHSVFCVRWTGITSAICRVDADYGGWTAVTDSSAIRDLPDAWFDQNENTSYVIYQREVWDEQNLMGFGGRPKHGTGIFRSRYRRPVDGEMGASTGVLALDRIEPNPVSGRVKLSWQIPTAGKVDLRVYNPAGQLVKVLAQGEVKPGRYTTTWAGTDQKGRRLAAGIYFCALDTGDKRLTRKVVLAE